MDVKNIVDEKNVEKIETLENGEKIIHLNEEGHKDMFEKMNDPSYDYIKKFITATLENKDKVSEDFYNFIIKLNNFITEYNAPWYVPVYQSIKNGLVALVHINTNHDTYKDHYECLLEAIGEQLHHMIDNFNPDTEEYKTYPIKYSIANIFSYAQGKCNYPGNILEEYNNKIEMLKAQRAKEENELMKIMVIMTDIMEKANKHNSKRKEYRFLFNRILLDAKPSKYKLKLPKKLELMDLLDVCRILSSKYDTKEFIQKFKIPYEVVKVLELDEDELKKIHDENIKKKLINEVEELKNIAQELEKISGGAITVDMLAKDIDDKELEEILKKSIGVDTNDDEETK